MVNPSKEDFSSDNQLGVNLCWFFSYQPIATTTMARNVYNIAEPRLLQTRKCIDLRGVKLGIKIKAYAKPGDLISFTKNRLYLAFFSKLLHTTSTRVNYFAINIMHDLGDLNVSLLLATRFKGYSLSVQC